MKYVISNESIFGHYNNKYNRSEMFGTMIQNPKTGESFGMIEFKESYLFIIGNCNKIIEDIVDLFNRQIWKEVSFYNLPEEAQISFAKSGFSDYNTNKLSDKVKNDLAKGLV